jgi:hypothetical protein
VRHILRPKKAMNIIVVSEFIHCKEEKVRQGIHT